MFYPFLSYSSVLLPSNVAMGSQEALSVSFPQCLAKKNDIQLQKLAGTKRGEDASYSGPARWLCLWTKMLGGGAYGHNGVTMGWLLRLVTGGPLVVGGPRQFYFILNQRGGALT